MGQSLVGVHWDDSADSSNMYITADYYNGIHKQGGLMGYMLGNISGSTSDNASSSSYYSSSSSAAGGGSSGNAAGGQGQHGHSGGNNQQNQQQNYHQPSLGGGCRRI